MLFDHIFFEILNNFVINVDNANIESIKVCRVSGLNVVVKI